MDEAKVKALAENIQEMMALHDRQKDNYMKLFKICLKHLKHKNPFVPPEVQAEKQKLIEALEGLTMLEKGQKHE